METDLESLRQEVRARGEISEALHHVAAHALDLTLACLTTDGVPDDIRKRAYLAHRTMLAYRRKYDLRSRGEVERAAHDPAIDAPAVRGQVSPDALAANAERLADYYRTNPDVKAWLGDLS